MSVEVYFLHLKNFLDRPIEKYLHLFSDERREKILRYKFLADRNRTVWAELSARSIAAKKFLDAFKNYVADKKMSATWQKIIAELQKILDWENRPAPDKIAQMKSTYDEKNGTMNVDEKFKLRLPLKNIFEVVK